MTVANPETRNFVQEELFPYEEDNNPDVRTHIINPEMNSHIYEPGMKAKDIVEIARLTGVEVVALCNYRWVPKRNPDKYPVCEKCMAEAYKYIQEAGL